MTIDVETANSDIGSIFQIGMAKYIKGKLVDTYCHLIRPASSFSQVNIGIHGIDTMQVTDAPSMFNIYGSIISVWTLVFMNLNWSVVIIDATKTPIERPKKPKRLLQR